MAINKGSERKLKRGLHDLSPLFQLSTPQATEDAPSAEAPFDVQFLTVCVPDHEGDAFLANAYLASQVARQANLFSFLVSITPGGNSLSSPSGDPFPSLELLDSRISRLHLSHEALWHLAQNGSSQNALANGGPASAGGLAPAPTSRRLVNEIRDPAPFLAPFLIFLEFEPSQFRSLERIALLLDRVILFVQPQVEGLREAYRLIKKFSRLNRKIEFLLLFRGEPFPGGKEEFLFERFALITSRFLGISPVWLGDLDFHEKNDPAMPLRKAESKFHLEGILTEEGLVRPLAPEKARFWHEFQKILGPRFSYESPLSYPR